MKLKAILAALTALLLAACNPMEQLDGTEQIIERYQQTYNSGDARALYGQVSEEFRRASTAEQMAGLVEFISGNLGQIESSERNGFNINTENGLTTTTVTMITQFEKGEGEETYVFYGQGEDLRIVAWNVNSTALAQGNEVEAEAETEPAE